MNIHYTKDIANISDDMLDGGFFVDWANPPGVATHLKILTSSYCSFVAIDKKTNKVIGFINVISDGILTAYIPLLEVLPEYQGKGVGKELVRLVLEELKDLYMIDICHDEELAPFYAELGAYSNYSSLFRNYNAQSGRKNI
ncbi:MAG: GNAT family N-acetyltransferase [Oscillospiraceae bacterium]|jgi:ribosomal protein S18 acetylase RimI-like enzyme|nr:GNAT family N-acetyltransferase [Oscillospiraceae bacterium]